jgi:hypothetical protein
MTVEAYEEYYARTGNEKSDYYREQYHLGNFRRACCVCGVKDLEKLMHVEDTHRDKQISLADKDCPECDGVMMVRVSRKWGNKGGRWLFSGCSNFPRCKYKEKYRGNWYKDGKLVIEENKVSPDFYCEQHYRVWQQ